MDLRSLLTRYSKGELSIDELQKEISFQSIEQVANSVAQLDINREVRKEIPEVIFAKGKRYQDLLDIVTTAARRNNKVVLSKIQPEQLVTLSRTLKRRGFNVEVGKNSSTILVYGTKNSSTSYDHHREIDSRYQNPSSWHESEITEAKVGILAAGTSDIGIAEEARLMAKAMNCTTLQSYDVGIAGIHRVFPALKEMISENVGAIVVVAGMEGALPSVVTSMVNVPVIGVPTSVGYGFGSDGVAALASMLQSCTLGLCVVNIDNGIGAGAFAALICKQLARRSTRTHTRKVATWTKKSNKNSKSNNNNKNKNKSNRSL